VTRARVPRRTARPAPVALAVVALLIGGCAPAAPGTSAPVGSASLGPALSGSPITATSPVEGLLVRLDSEGLTKVDGGIVKGSPVHVKGVTLPVSVLAPSNQQIIATEITKR